MEEIEPSQSEKTNGAGIAADPTLTVRGRFLHGIPRGLPRPNRSWRQVFSRSSAPRVSAWRGVRFCHRRSHRHPVRSGWWAFGSRVRRLAFACSAGSEPSGPSRDWLPHWSNLRAARSWCRARRPFLRFSTGLSSPWPPTSSGSQHFHRIGPRPSAMSALPGRGQWSPRRKTYENTEISIPKDVYLETFSLSRWLETAPRKRVGQGDHARVIHAVRFSLWTAVDNSAARRGRSVT